METDDEAKGRAPGMAQDRGEKLDETVEKVGQRAEEKVGPPAEKVADKVVDATGGMPDDPDR